MSIWSGNQKVSRPWACPFELTFRRAIYDFVFLRSMLQDALWAEHVTILRAIELDLLAGMGGTVLNLTLSHWAGAEGWVGRSGHGQTGQHLVVDRQIVRVDLMCALVIGALNDAVLGQLTDTFTAEGMTAREGSRFFIVVIVRLKADSALENGLRHF